MRLGRAVVVATILATAGGRLDADTSSKWDARAAFESLKKLAGDWQLHVDTTDSAPMSARYRVTSAGSVVEEVWFSGSDREMVSMYHMNGKELVMTHSCAAGNQPRIRFNQAQSRPEELSFDFTGGSNMDPAVDGHMHSGRILFKDDAHVDHERVGYVSAKPSATKRFILTRKGR